MTLTPQNMESKEGWHSHTIFRDIPRMDEQQLDRYIRLVFSGQEDLEWLPDPFWNHFWFNNSVHGDTYSGREAPSPAVFLSGIHDMIGSTSLGTFIVGEKTDKKPTFGFRPIYRKVLSGILDELSGLEGEPTEEQKLLASFTVEAAGNMQTEEEFMFGQEGKLARSRGGEKEPVSLKIPDELKIDLEALKVEHPKLLEKAQGIIESGRFGKLKLRYDAQTYIKRF